MSMCVEMKGMKRSLPCMDLISMQGLGSMQSIDQNPLLRLMDNYMSAIDTTTTSISTSTADTSSAKKRRLAPLVNEDTPATQALEHFLLFAIHDTPSLLPMDDDSSCSSIESDESTFSTSCSHSMYTSKSNYRLPSMHDVTRGMAEISHH